MAQQIPDRIKKLVFERNYRLSSKADYRMALDGLDDSDIQEAFSFGYLWKKEVDEKKYSIDGYKYVIIGLGVHCPVVYTVGKIMKDDEGHLYYFIESHKGE